MSGFADVVGDLTDLLAGRCRSGSDRVVRALYRSKKPSSMCRRDIRTLNGSSLADWIECLGRLRVG